MAGSSQVLLRADLHCHTIYSYDCHTTVDQLVRRCSEVGINCLAVTDHNEIEGALRVRERAPFKVIVGEEILTREGEVIGLFLEERIENGLSMAATIDRIKAQGGLVYLPHPVSGIRKSRVARESVIRSGHKIDVVELYNSRTVGARQEDWEWVHRLIMEHNAVVAAASDAHCVWEFGNALVEMRDFHTTGDFLASLSEAKLRFRRAQWWVRVMLNHNVRKLLRRMKGHG